MVFAVMQFQGFLAHLFRRERRCGIGQSWQFESHGILRVRQRLDAAVCMGRLARGQPCTTPRSTPPPGDAPGPIAVPPSDAPISDVPISDAPPLDMSPSDVPPSDVPALDMSTL